MRADHGSASVMIIGLVGLLGVLAVATAALGGLFAARAQSDTAADAAALAAAVATYPPASSARPADAARRVAGMNSAQLVSCECATDASVGARTVTVVVGVPVDVPILGSFIVKAVARAEFDPRRWLGW